MTPPRDNPFRVDCVATLSFIGDVPGVIARLDEAGRGAIVGPHGAGKSTLLRAVVGELHNRGRRVELIGLPGGASAAERDAAVAGAIDAAHADAAGHGSTDVVICFDGCEQLSRRQAARLSRVARLLVTAHRRTRWPTLIELRPTVATLDAVLGALVGDVPPALRIAAHAAFARHRGDVRATLFELYDVLPLLPPPARGGGPEGHTASTER